MGRQKEGSKATGGKRAPVDRQEVEWQFEAADLESVGAWLEQHSSGTGLAVVPEGTAKITDTYFDTEDWRLYRAGYALRLRKEGDAAEATMKSLGRAEGPTDGADGGDSVEGEAWRRREITEPLGDAKAATLLEAPGPVGERLRALAGDRKAAPVFEVRTSRRTFALRLEAGGTEGDEEPEDGTGPRIGEVTLDETRIPLGEREEPATLSRVEVEAGAGTAPSPDLRGFVDEVRFALGLRPTATSKYEAGLYATGLSPDGEPDLGPMGVEPSMTAGEVAFAVLRRQFAEMRAHEPGTRLGDDPEELHDMRVATRRMRAAIKLFEDALPERTVWLREELRFFAGVLGEVRDLDVQMEDFRTRARGEEDEEGLQRILDLLHKRRGEARGRMLEALDSGRYERFEGSFAELLRRGPGAEAALSNKDGRDRSREPITDVAPDVVATVRRKWRKAARRLAEAPETSSPEDYHELRKKGKRLRYALEFLSGVYGGATAGPVRELKAVQDDLGHHQDAVVFADFLRELGTSTGGPRIPRAAAFAAGVLAERYAREAAGIRAGFPGSKPFRALRKGKAWKELEKAQKGPHGKVG